MDCFASLAMMVPTRATLTAVIAREGGRSSIPETPVMESRSRGVLDTPLEPVIGLAEGETRWRGMIANFELSRPCRLPAIGEMHRAVAPGGMRGQLTGCDIIGRHGGSRALAGAGVELHPGKGSVGAGPPREGSDADTAAGNGSAGERCCGR